MTTQQILAGGWTVFVRAFLRSLALLGVAALIYAPVWTASYFVTAQAAKTLVPHYPSPWLVVPVIVATAILELIPMAGLLAVAGATANDELYALSTGLQSALRRLPAMLGTTLLSILAMCGFVILVFALVFGLSLGATALGPGPGTVLGVVIGIPLACAVVVAYVFLYTAVVVALSACAYEKAGPIDALRTALQRCCRREHRHRTLLVGLVSVVPLQLIGVAFLLAAPALQRAGTVAFWSVYVLELASQAVLFLLGYAWITVFSLDARARDRKAA